MDRLALQVGLNVIDHDVGAGVIWLWAHQLRRHAARAGLFEDAHSARLHGPRQSLPGVVLNALGIGLAYVNVYLALVCLILVPLLYFVPWAWRVAAKGVKHKVKRRH